MVCKEGGSCARTIWSRFGATVISMNGLGRCAGMLNLVSNFIIVSLAKSL